MDSSLNPYVSLELPDNVLPDVWDQDSEQVSVDILMPNGYFLSMRVRRHITLLELKEEVWESSRHLPLFRLLRDVDAYSFQCVNLGTAERDELKDESKTLDETRPFQAVLRLRERGVEEAGKQLDGRLGSVLGIGLKLFDKQTDPEVADFRREVRGWCESVVSVSLDSGTWESRVLRQHPVSVDPSSPSLPPYLHSRLHDGEMVVAISVPQLASESTFKFSVPPSLTGRGLVELVLRKKGQSIGLQDVPASSLLLKMCGLEEYLIGPHALAQYKYIQDNLSCDKIPELVLVSTDTIQLEGVEGVKEDLPRSPDSLSSLKRKNKMSVSSWTVDEPFRVTIHSVHRLNYDSKTKVCVQCALYHGDDMLDGRVQHTAECTLEEGCCTWEEEWQFDVQVADIPRAARLCICVYESSTTQKTSRFRKYQDKYACPVAWVNTTVFDYKGELRSGPQTLSTWPYAQEGDEYSSVMVRPLGWLTPNPCHEPAGVVTLSFGRYHQTAQVLYPTMEEIVSYSSLEPNDRDGSFSHSGVPQPSKLHIQQLQQICERDALYQLHEQEKELMWFLRKHCCEQLPSSLPKLLRCVKWSDRAEVAEMMRLLQIWPPLSPYKALELLDYAYPDPIVRSFAVRCLRGLPDLSLYMLQLVQALKHECYLNNALAKFLLERALLNRHHGHRFFWLLRSEIHFPEVCVRFGLMLEAYCRSVPNHLDALEKQVRAIGQLKIANKLVQNKANIKKEGKEKLKCHIQDFLGKTLYQTIFHGLQNPLDPRFKFGKIRVEKCKFLDSKMKPLWLAFENTDAHGKDVFLIFKNGDDLRQDMLTLQMIRIMDRLWKDEGLDLRLIPYQCMATGHRVGLIEVVPDADTIANIQKEKGFTATSAFKKGSILAWLRDHNPDDISLSRAAEEFTLSCAGYSVATYVLGVADRHSDNIMVKTNGQLFHVDFGHILGKFKEKFGFKRERVPFVLTHDFVYIITKGQTQRSQEFTRFQQYCERAFMILRRRGPLVISLFAMMLSTGIPELSSERDLDYLRDTLVLDMSEQDALRHFRSKFDEALKNSWKTSVNWAAHNLAKDNKMADG